MNPDDFIGKYVIGKWLQNCSRNVIGGIYITPMISFAWTDNRRKLWIGWLKWLFVINLR